MLSISPGGATVLVATQALPFGVAITDPHGKVTWANTAYAQLAGCTPDELLGQPAGEFDWEALSHVAPSSEPWRGQAVCRRRTGEAYSVEHNITALRDPAGEVTGFWVIQRHATDPKRPAGTPDQAEANLSALIESTEDLIWSVDLDFRLLTFNRALRNNIESTFGVRVAVGMHQEDWLPAERAVLWRSMYARALAEGPYRAEHPLLDGRILELSFNPILKDGQAVGVSVFGKDITERKEAEKALREAEAKYRNIFDGALEGIYRNTPQGRCLDANPALAKMLGYDSVKDFVSTVTDVAHQVWLNPDDRTRCLQLLEPYGFVRGFESQFKRKDGTAVWVSVNIKRVGGPDDQTAYYEGFIEDINDRTQAANALHKSEDKFAKVFLCSPAVMVLTDSDDRLLEVSEAFASVTGYRREDVVGRTIQELKLWSDPRQFDEYRNHIRTDGRIRSMEFHFHRRNGERATALISGEPIELDGKACRVAAILDITERRDAEKQYRDIFEGAQEGIYRTSIERNFVAANSSMARILGYDSPQELVSLITDTNVQLWVDPTDRSRCGALLDEDGSVRGFECQLKRKDGTGLWALINARRVTGPDGRALFYDGFVQDITERKRMEDALRRSEETFATAFKSSPAMTAVFRPDQTGNWIIDVNDAFEQNTGYRREEMVGHTSQELHFWADSSELEEAMAKLRTDGAVRNFKYHFRKKTGEVRTGLLSTASIELDGRACGISTTIDITEQEKAEQAIQQANEAAAKAERHYRLMFNSVSDALFVHKFGRDGLPNHFQEVNDNACRYLGYTRNELLQMGPSDIDSPEERVLLPNRAQRIRTDGHYMWEGTHIAKDGRRIPVEINSHLVDLDGEQTLLSSVRDISDRKAAERQYREIFDGALEGIYRTTFEGRNLAANPALATMLGYDSPEEVVSTITDSAKQTWLEPENRTEFLRLLKEQGVVRGYKCQYKRKDGTAIWVSLNSRIVYDLNRQPLYTEGFIEDISERKRMEDALRKSAETLATLFRSSPNTTILFKLVDNEYQIADVNEAFEQRTGYRRDEVVGQTIEAVGLWADPNEGMEYMKRFRANGRVGSFEHRFRTKHGDLGVCLSSAESIEIDGMPYAIAAIIDITKQKQVEDTMRSLVTAIDHSADTIVITDLNGIIQYCNPAFERITGYSKEEAVGQNPRVLKSGKHDTEFYQQMWTTIMQGNVWTGHLINKKKDGSFYEEDATISPIRNASGKISGFVAVKRDVTERLQLENQLRQAQKLESIGRLAGGVAHDFNNLLTVINGYSGFLLKRLKAGDPLRSYAEEIQTAGERAASLTKQLLAFSRKQVIEPKVVDLNAVIRESVAMLQRLIGDDIVLETHLDGSLGQVVADPDQIHQVIMNLAVNARDAMSDGGTLDIETVNIELDQNAASHPDRMPGRYVLMTVTDTGHGMDETIRKQVFEPFFTTKGVGKGTGLGLSTVYGIIRQNGGWIDVWSEVGVGAAFKIYLPRIDASSVVEREEMIAPSEDGCETILVVEDEEAVRAFAKAALKQVGYQVIEASDGDEAISVATQHSGQIDLLLTDVVMPGLNGKDLSEHLTMLYPGLKVLFISGYTADVIAHRGVLEPGVAFLQKPFSLEELAAKVRDVLAEPSNPTVQS